MVSFAVAVVIGFSFFDFLSEDCESRPPRLPAYKADENKTPPLRRVVGRFAELLPHAGIGQQQHTTPAASEQLIWVRIGGAGHPLSIAASPQRRQIASFLHRKHGPPHRS